MTMRTAIVISLFMWPSAAVAQQWTAADPGSDNITVLANLPLGPRLSVADLDLEQEPTSSIFPTPQIPELFTSGE